MKKPRSVGLVYGPDLHHLDHISVLCTLLQIPLVVTEEKLYHLAEKYYPELIVYHYNTVELPIKMIAEYEIIFSSLPRDLISQIFFVAENLQKKKLLSVWTPHGNSDKGYLAEYMEGLSKEKIVLAYGEKMLDFLKEKGVFDLLYRALPIGNYRKVYYEKRKPFYDQIIEKEVASLLERGKPTIFYAPTWEDSEKSGSFFEFCPTLIKNLPDAYNLIVKVHPNILLQKEAQYREFTESHTGRKNLLFLVDFPPIYALLDFVDIYIGDMSSIGYDFLTFDKPMYFINLNGRADKGTYLFQAGIEIAHKNFDKIYEIIEKTLPTDRDNFSAIRSEIDRYVFKNMDAEENPRLMIEEVCETFLDEEPFF